MLFRYFDEQLTTLARGLCHNAGALQPFLSFFRGSSFLLRREKDPSFFDMAINTDLFTNDIPDQHKFVS